MPHLTSCCYVLTIYFSLTKLEFWVNLPWQVDLFTIYEAYRMKRIQILFLLTFTAVSYDIKADVLLSQYEQVKNSAFFKPYINGIGVGYFWANAELNLRNAKKLFCLPNNVDLDANAYSAILDDQIAYTQFKQPSWPIGAFLLQGLKRKYPCK